VLGSGSPVVLVHGTPSRSYVWRNVARSLAERHTVYVFDLLGFGESEKRAGMNTSIPAQARVLAGLVDLWGLEEPAVAGHDIGGAIVLRSHLLDGVPYGRIALIDAVVLRPWITPATRHKQDYPDAYRTMPNHIFEQTVIAHLRTATARPMDEATFDAVFGQWRGEEGQARYMRNLTQFDEGYTAEFEPLLGSMQTPVRIIWGERDAWLAPAFASRLRELLPNSDLKLIPEAGHFVMEDAPEEVARELQNFFAADGGTADDAPEQRDLEPRRGPGVPDYLKQPLAGFLDLVASDEPAPGGGAVAAVAVSLAAGLCGMSARLSTGHLADSPELVEQAEHVRLRVAPLAQEDAIAYGRVLAAQRAPEDGEPEARRERIKEALSGAADVPLDVAEAGAEVAGIAERLARDGNPNLRGDTIAAALLAEAGTRAAAALVRINTAAGNISDGRSERADELASKAAGAARRAVEGDG
jgi:pimeloyl-ACP methyl ester carboxylesterase/formiminotetrahydrofolate cyclodeaminase